MQAEMSVAREVDTIVEALRATREAATVARGLKCFRKALRGDDAPLSLSTFLTRAPQCEELHRLWDAPIVVCLMLSSIGPCLTLQALFTLGLAMPGQGQEARLHRLV